MLPLLNHNFHLSNEIHRLPGKELRAVGRTPDYEAQDKDEADRLPNGRTVGTDEQPSYDETGAQDRVRASERRASGYKVHRGEFNLCEKLAVVRLHHNTFILYLSHERKEDGIHVRGVCEENRCSERYHLPVA